MKRTTSVLIVVLSLAWSVQPSIAGELTREQLIQQEISYEDSGDLVGAIGIAQKILKSNPRDVQTINVIAGLYGLAAIYANSKRYDAAIATLDRLLALNLNDQDAKSMRSKIKDEQSRVR